MALLLLWWLLSRCICRQQTYPLWAFILLGWRSQHFFFFFFNIKSSLYSAVWIHHCACIRTTRCIFHGLTKALDDGIRASSLITESPCTIIFDYVIAFCPGSSHGRLYPYLAHLVLWPLLLFPAIGFLVERHLSLKTFPLVVLIFSPQIIPVLKAIQHLPFWYCEPQLCWQCPCALWCSWHSCCYLHSLW